MPGKGAGLGRVVETGSSRACESSESHRHGWTMDTGHRVGEAGQESRGRGGAGQVVERVG